MYLHKNSKHAGVSDAGLIVSDGMTMQGLIFTCLFLVNGSLYFFTLSWNIYGHGRKIVALHFY